MKKAISLLLALVLVFSLVACGEKEEAPAPEGGDTPQVSDGKNYDNVTLKLSYITGDTAMDGVTAIEFERLVEERSGGVVKIDRFGNGQLANGDMARHVEMMLAGGVFELAIINESLFADIDPYFNVSSTPFLFKNFEEAYAKVDGEAKELHKERFAALGVRHLGTFPNDMLQLANTKHEIRTPADLKNMKMRTIGDVQMTLMRSCGADPTNLAWSELYTALQTGAVDGNVNGYQTIYSASMHETLSHITEVNMVFTPYAILANEAAIGKLSADTQALLEECAEEAAIYGRKFMDEAAGDCKQAMIDSGVSIYVPTDAELEEFKAAAAPAIAKIKELVGEEACAVWGVK